MKPIFKENKDRMRIKILNSILLVKSFCNQSTILPSLSDLKNSMSSSEKSVSLHSCDSEDDKLLESFKETFLYPTKNENVQLNFAKNNSWYFL